MNAQLRQFYKCPDSDYPRYSQHDCNPRYSQHDCLKIKNQLFLYLIADTVKNWPFNGRTFGLIGNIFSLKMMSFACVDWCLLAMLIVKDHSEFLLEGLKVC